MYYTVKGEKIKPTPDIICESIEYLTSSIKEATRRYELLLRKSKQAISEIERDEGYARLNALGKAIENGIKRRDRQIKKLMKIKI